MVDWRPGGHNRPGCAVGDTFYIRGSKRPALQEPDQNREMADIDEPETVEMNEPETVGKE